MKKYLPMSLGLFLGGVFLCFGFVLPITLAFLLEFNVWLGVAPTLRLSEWMSFATILPLVFGIAFQTPLVMLFLERIGIFTVDDFRAKRKIAILIITIAAAVLTPGQDPFSMTLLAVPMILLYELGILLIGRGKKRSAAGLSRPTACEYREHGLPYSGGKRSRRRDVSSDPSWAVQRVRQRTWNRSPSDLIGLGTVGTGVARILTEHAERIARRAGKRIRWKWAVVRDPPKPRDVSLEGVRVTTDVRPADRRSGSRDRRRG